MIEAMVGFVVLCAAGLSAAEPDYISGRAFAAMKDGARAVADLRNAADTILYDDNTKGLALIALGRAYRDLLKDDTGALAAFRETCATMASAKHCEAALEAAGILTRQNKLKDALAELDTVDVAKLSHGYWSGSLLAARGSVLAKLGKAADAAAQYRAALRQHPLYPAQKTVYEKALKELQGRDGRR